MLASRHVSKVRHLNPACRLLRYVSTNASFVEIPENPIPSEPNTISQKPDSPLLLRIKKAFPDSSTSRYLHSRIDLLLSKDPTVRVGIVPLQPFSSTSNTLQETSRSSIKSLLDSVLLDPLSSDQTWQTTLKDRNLSKNCVVSHSPTFDGSTTTHNSIVEYEVPFLVSREGLFEIEPFHDINENTDGSKTDLNSAEYALKYQQVPELSPQQNEALNEAKYHMSFIEMTSPKDSIQHMLKCHRLVYVTADPIDVEAVRADPIRYLPVSTPYRVLIDYPAEKLKYTANSTVSRIEKNTQAPVVSSAMQSKANELFGESPAQNVDKYIELHARANLAAMNRATCLFPTPKKYDEVYSDSDKGQGASHLSTIPSDVFHGTNKPTDVGNLQNAKLELAQTVLRTCLQIVDTADAVTTAIAKEGSEMGTRRKQWAVEAHTELQKTLEAHLNAMFSGIAATRLRKKEMQSRKARLVAEGKENETEGDDPLLDTISADSIPWYKLYWKVDEVYSIVDEIFLRYYFLPRAQDRYKYLQGRIDQFADLHHLPLETETEFKDPDTIIDASTKGNLVEQLKNDINSVTTTSGTSKSSQDTKTDASLELFDHARAEILRTAGTELHNSALRVLLTNFFGVQVPLIVLPLCAVYLLDYCSLYAAGSMMALGTAVGFSRLQKGWQRATNKFKASVMESARLAINKAEQELFKRWEARVKAQESVTMKRKGLINELKSVLDKEASI